MLSLPVWSRNPNISSVVLLRIRVWLRGIGGIRLAGGIVFFYICIYVWVFLFVVVSRNRRSCVEMTLDVGVCTKLITIRRIVGTIDSVGLVVI